MAQLPPGFQLEKKSAALPPGFQLERRAVQPQVNPVVQPQVNAAPVTGGTIGPDPSLDLPVPAGQFADGVWTPSGGIDPAFTPTDRGGGPPLRAPSSDPMRSLEVGFQGMRRGAAAVPGTFIDLANVLPSAVGNLSLMGADAGVDALGNLFGQDWGVPLRLPPQISANPVGGTDFNTDVIEAVMPGEPFKPEEMTPGQRLGYKANEFATGALLPSTVLAAPITRTAAQVAKSPMLEALTRPYTKGATPMSDAVAGGGAGVGSFAYDEYVPEPVKEMLGPIGEVLSMLGGATGANLLENAVKTTGRAITGTAKHVATGGVETDLPLNPDGSFVKSADADAAALYLRGMMGGGEKGGNRAADAARFIRGGKEGLGEAGDRVTPTTGAMSNNPEMIAGEQVARMDPKLASDFVRRDQSVNRAALDSAQQIAPENAVGRQFTDTIDQQHNQRVDVAERRVDWTKAHKQEVDVRQAQDATGVEMARGGKSNASTRLDEVVAPTLTEAQGRRSAAYADLDPNKEVMRSVDPLLSVVDEMEAAVGPLNNPASMPADWISRIRAIADPEQGGTGQISFADLNAARPELAGEIAAAKKAGNFQLADNLTAIRRVIDEEAGRVAAEGGEAGARAQNALGVEREFSEVWRQGPNDAANKYRQDFNRDRGNRSFTDPSQTAKRFLQPGQPERVASLKRVIKDSPNGARAAGEFLEADLADAGVVQSGRVNPEAVRKWKAKWGDDALNLSPEFRKNIDDLLQRADINANDAGILARQLEDAAKQLAEAKTDTDAIRRVLGKEPVKAVSGILSADDPEAAIKEIVASIQGNESARNGLKAAVREFLMERGTTSAIQSTGDGRRPLSWAKLDETWDKYENVLAEIFTPEEMHSLQVSHRFLAPFKNLDTKTLANSQSTPRQIMWNSVKGPLEVGFKLRYGVLKGGGLMRTLDLWQQMLPNGDKAAVELIERMWFDPDLAAQLLTRNVSHVGSSAYNKKLIRLLSYGAGARELVEE